MAELRKWIVRWWRAVVRWSVASPLAMFVPGVLVGVVIGSAVWHARRPTSSTGTPDIFMGVR